MREVSIETPFTDLTAGLPRAHRRIGLRSLAKGCGQLVIEGDDEFVGAGKIAVRTLALESETFLQIAEAM